MLAGEFLKQMKPFVEEGVHPRIIIRSFRRAIQIAVDKTKQLSEKIDNANLEEQRSMLEKCAATAMSSKLIHQQKDFFSKLVVDAVLLLDELLPLNMIGIKKVIFFFLHLIQLKMIQIKIYPVNLFAIRSLVVPLKNRC